MASKRQRGNNDSLPPTTTTTSTTTSTTTATSTTSKSPISIPFDGSSVTITQTPPPGFQYDNSMPSTFDTSMFPPCLRPLIQYTFPTTNSFTHNHFFHDIFPFTPEHIIFIYTELIENDLYCNVTTQDWINLTGRLNITFHTQFNFRDVRHYALRIVLQTYITWLQSQTPNTIQTNYQNTNSPSLALVGFYYHGVLLHSAIKEGCFDILNCSTLIFPDPVYEFHMDTGFIPPTRRTLHNINGDVTIHNPTELSTKFQPQLHANNPHWRQTDQKVLKIQYNQHPNHHTVPFIPHEQIYDDNQRISCMFPVTQNPQQYITIHNTTANPTSGLSPWGPISIPQLTTDKDKYKLRQVGRTFLSSHTNVLNQLINNRLQELRDPNATNIGPTSFLNEKHISVHLIDQTVLNNGHKGPYDHLQPENENFSIKQDVTIHQINKYYFPNELDTHINIIIQRAKLHSPTLHKEVYGCIVPFQNPIQSSARNNYILRHTFHSNWINTHRDRYGDFGAYLLDQIHRFHLYMERIYPRQFNLSRSITFNGRVPATTNTTITVTSIGSNYKGSFIGNHNNTNNINNNSTTTTTTYIPVKPYNGYKFADDWSLEIDQIPDCRSQRLFDPTIVRNNAGIKITPTKTWGDIVCALTQPIVDGKMAVPNPIDTPLQHPLYKSTTMFPAMTQAERSDQTYMSSTNYQRRNDLTQVNSTDTGIWGFYDDGWYTNNGFVFQIRPPEAPIKLLIDAEEAAANATAAHQAKLAQKKNGSMNDNNNNKQQQSSRGGPRNRNNNMNDNNNDDDDDDNYEDVYDPYLLHPEESRFYFILQQKMALYFLRRALRRSYLDIFFMPSINGRDDREGSPPIDQSNADRYTSTNDLRRTEFLHIASATLPIIGIQSSPTPNITARKFILGKTIDDRLLPLYDDILLKLTHAADTKTSLGINLGLISRLNQSFYLQFIFSQTFITYLTSVQSQLKKFLEIKVKPNQAQQQQQQQQQQDPTVGEFHLPLAQYFFDAIATDPVRNHIITSFTQSSNNNTNNTIRSSKLPTTSKWFQSIIPYLARLHRADTNRSNRHQYMYGYNNYQNEITETHFDLLPPSTLMDNGKKYYQQPQQQQQPQHILQHQVYQQPQFVVQNGGGVFYNAQNDDTSDDDMGMDSDEEAMAAHDVQNCSIM